jgi:hypothetical protein
LQAFADWKGFRDLRELNQDVTIEFRRAWEDANAGYKRGYEKSPGVPRWHSNSLGTCRRSAKTLKYFFRHGISRKWIIENPSDILRFPKPSSAKTKEDVTHLTTEQFKNVLAQCDNFTRMTQYNRQRFKA